MLLEERFAFLSLRQKHIHDMVNSITKPTHPFIWRYLPAAKKILILGEYVMKKSGLLLLLAGLLTAGNAFAQNSIYRYKTNNRNATESVDAAVYNPAGLVWLQDGFHVEIGNQFGFGTKEIYDGLTGITYEATGGSAFDPTAIFIYKKDKWAGNFAFGASSATGGKMENGSPMLTMGGYRVAMGMAAGVNQALTSPPIGLPGMLVDPFTQDLYGPDGGSLEEGALDLGFLANVAYKVSNGLSFSVGAKYMYRADDFMRGNIMVATNAQAIADFETSLLTDAGLSQEQVDAIIGGVPVVNGDVARVDASYEDNNFWVFSVGANIRPTEKFLIAQTLYFGPTYTAHLELNDLYLIDPALLPQLEELLGMKFEDGAPDERKVVPLYKLGVAYHVTDKFRVEADLHVDFKHIAESNDLNEYAWGLGAEYQVSKKVNWGAGFKYQPIRRSQDDMSDTDFKNDMLWLASGIDVKFTDRLTGVATVELGLATSEYIFYMEDGTTILKSYKDNMNQSGTLGVVYRF
ncbi:MAG: hypothetical protein DRP71_14235 [Verrucomicrobia bacterium]|nr:MAG: hypothetical protein DRP71_14235 [Verrucomicrobiota bacterium]